MKVRIVMVDPREGGNLGAAARVMKNFGFRDLVVVGRRPDLETEPTAPGLVVLCAKT